MLWVPTLSPGAQNGSPQVGLFFPGPPGEEPLLVHKGFNADQGKRRVKLLSQLLEWFFQLFGLKAIALCWKCSTSQKTMTSLQLGMHGYKQLGRFFERKESFTKFEGYLISFRTSSHWRKHKQVTSVKTKNVCCDHLGKNTQLLQFPQPSIPLPGGDDK